MTEFFHAVSAKLQQIGKERDGVAGLPLGDLREWNGELWQARGAEVELTQAVRFRARGGKF